MKWGTLFSGGGGSDTGLVAAGHTVAWGVEMEPEIAACYHTNHPNSEIIVSDVRNVDISALSPIDGLWASPVCKQDSQARGKNLDRREDAAIGRAILPYIEMLQPELVIIENVAGYRTNPVCSQIVAFLRNKMHYHVEMRVLDAANYGVPQHRERLIIQARRGGAIAWPAYTVRRAWHAALTDLIGTLAPSSLIPWQMDRWKPEYDALRPLIVNGHFDYDHGTEKRELSIVPWNRPISTITSSHNNRDKRIVLADGRVLELSIQALARLQTFPDWYQWPDDKRLAMEIIGNAVPPLFAQRIVESYDVSRQAEPLWLLEEEIA